MGEYEQYQRRRAVRLFILPRASRPILEPIQLLQWMKGTFSPHLTRRGAKLPAHFLLVPRLRMGSSIFQIPPSVIMMLCLIN
jgi:hypothetical protein